MLWIGLIVVVLVILLGFVAWRVRQSRRLSAAAVTRLSALLEKASRVPDPVLRIIEYDKVLNQLLDELRFKGSTGEKLMKAGPRFSNKEALWKYHKIRNVIAHQAGATATIAEAERFHAVLVQAIRQVS